MYMDGLADEKQLQRLISRLRACQQGPGSRGGISGGDFT